MYPEDRVLVAYVPRPKDFELIRTREWYRVPQRYAPKGLYAEYFAFYFGRKFGPEKWAIIYYARNLGHELVTRRELFPEQTEHPRVDEPYFKVQLGPIQALDQPILSLRWRRVTFIHTTWDRFKDAREINDLFIEGGPYVDRVYATLKERGIQAERNYRVSESAAVYDVPLMIPCQLGRVEVSDQRLPHNEDDALKLVEELIHEMAEMGGIRKSAHSLSME
jgi:hypothetical protein